MRKIVKGAEPEEWAEFRKTDGVSYEAKPELRDSLLKEQGYICAYCMRRIPVKDANSGETSRIDHVKSREVHGDLQMDYSNMVICCPGAINSDFHCDKSKKSQDVTFNLFDDAFIETLSYSSRNGSIKSSNPQYDTEINEILNLNNSLLKRNRQETLNGVIRFLNKKKWTSHFLIEQLRIWDEKDCHGMYKSYNGIVVWYLKKKLRTVRYCR